MKFFVLSFFLLLSACAPTSDRPDVSAEEMLQEVRYQKKIAIEEQMEQLKRLYRIGDKVLVANAELCGNKVWPHLGIMVESLSLVPTKFKDAVSIYYGVQNQLTAAYVPPGSPADGLILPGDRIVRLNDAIIFSGGRGKKAYYETLLDADMSRPLRFVVERGRKNRKVEVEVPVKPGCLSILKMEQDDEVNAYADGVNITFSTGTMREGKEDVTIASILGHELAHNAMLHNEAREINVFLAQVGSIIIEAATGLDLSDVMRDIGANAFSQEAESEADYVGMYMLARAGYDLEKGAEVERRFAVLYPDSIHAVGESHPASAYRFIMMKKTIQEIEEKKKKGIPLIPHEKQNYFY
jgi:Zn-dependent protease with chaperone function